MFCLRQKYKYKLSLYNKFFEEYVFMSHDDWENKVYKLYPISFHNVLILTYL